MRTYAKENECVNAPIGPFTTFSHCAYGYNPRSEVVSFHRGEMHRRSSASEGRFGVAEPEGCASICESAEETYSYDDIGNLVFNTFGAITNIYFSNSRNQYTSNLCASASLREINWNTMGIPWGPIVFLSL